MEIRRVIYCFKCKKKYACSNGVDKLYCIECKMYDKECRIDEHWTVCFPFLCQRCFEEDY